MDCDTTPAPPEKRDPYAAWKIRNYQLYAASWFSMTFAKQIETVAICIYIYQTYHTAQSTEQGALALGWLGLVQALPVMVLAIPGGQIADRWDRRTVVTMTLAMTGAVSLILAAAVYGQVPNLWIYLLLLAGAMGQALGGPSRTALLPQLVPGEDFSNAVAWNSTVFHIARVSGPALGGLIVAGTLGLPAGLSGVPAALAIVVFFRVVAMATNMCLPRRAVDPDRSATTISLKSLSAGIRFVWRHKPILATITLDLFAVLFGGVTYLFPIYAEDILGVGPSGVGFLQSADAAGAIVMALLLAHLPPIRRAGPTMLWAVAAFGVATIIFGLSPWFWLSFAMMFVAGAVDNISVVVRHTLVQMLTPDSMRGRVSAVNNVFIVASNDLGGLESGVTAWLLGPVISVVGGGIVTILVVLGAARLWPQILHIGSLQDLRPEEDAEGVGTGN